MFINREPKRTVSAPLRELPIQQFADIMLKSTGNTVAARNITEVLRRWRPIVDLLQPERRAPILGQLDENGGALRKLLEQAAEAFVGGPIPACVLNSAVERLADGINSVRIAVCAPRTGETNRNQFMQSGT
jgi:hypothetical protein